MRLYNNFCRGYFKFSFKQIFFFSGGLSPQWSCIASAPEHRASHSQITNLLPFYTMQTLNPSRIAITSRTHRNWHTSLNRWPKWKTILFDQSTNKNPSSLYSSLFSIDLYSIQWYLVIIWRVSFQLMLIICNVGHCIILLIRVLPCCSFTYPFNLIGMSNAKERERQEKMREFYSLSLPIPLSLSSFSIHFLSSFSFFSIFLLELTLVPLVEKSKQLFEIHNLLAALLGAYGWNHEKWSQMSWWSMWQFDKFTKILTIW